MEPNPLIVFPTNKLHKKNTHEPITGSNCSSNWWQILYAKGNKNKSFFLFAKDEWKNMCKTIYYKVRKKYNLKQLKISSHITEPLYDLAKFDVKY